MPEWNYEEREEVNLTTSKERGISKVAEEVGEALSNQQELFAKSNLVYRLNIDAKQRVDLVEEEEFSFMSSLDKYIIPVVIDEKKTKEALEKWSAEVVKNPSVPRPIPVTKYALNATKSKELLRSKAMKSKMPEIRAMFDCPMLIEQDGKLVEIHQYDPVSKIWCRGNPTQNMSVEEAKECINTMLQDFHFLTESDRARAIYSLLTPSIYFSGAMGRHRVPIQVTEANSSQSGKGYFNQLIQALFNTQIGKVSFSSSDKGLGSAMESISSVMISGKTFICLDNIRGVINEAKLESLATEDTFLARKLHADAELDPRDYYISMTSNSAAMTKDLANRSNILRIKRQPNGYVYAKFEEGDLISHIEANHAKFLGAVYTLIRHWHNLDKPEIRSTHNTQTFAKWAAIGNWFVKEVFGMDLDLLDEYDLIGQRISSDTLSYLRICANMVEYAGLTMRSFTAHELCTAAVGTADFEEQLGLNADDEHLSDGASRKLAAAFRRPRLVDGLNNHEQCVMRIEGFHVAQEAEDTEGKNDNSYTRMRYTFYTDQEFKEHFEPKPRQGQLDIDVPF